ncbi:NIPSNAP family protein [Phyllobacterium zundukense]|uniref:NIPSNAP family protein n=1 Tax=Phyllobacterium zundukense TaxID=1867719 RepID=A0ACD4D784_9HYPH|nr:NIPSNAP family protein [Phyllobacterium zundukense]UXN61710.1 NIPSNAP family protein [Phyllobacterium zundukense]
MTTAKIVQKLDRELHSPIVELRRYTLHPGRRDDLISLFDAHFLESQESCGIKVIGQFRDIDDPDAFVWLRGFGDMQARHQALTAFYDGPVWAAHRNAANDTMIDSDDVLLLRPAGRDAGFSLTHERPGRVSGTPSHAIIEAATYQLKTSVEGFLAFFDDVLAPLLRASGNDSIATFASNHSPNSFTRLPIRLGENVVVVFSRFDSIDDQSVFRDLLDDNPAWQAVQQRLATHLIAPPIITRLAPTARSLLR